MNNDLAQFSVERLEEIIECSELNDNSEIAALARIALAAKQAKPVAFTGSGSLSAIKVGHEGYIWGASAEAHPIELYTTPQPAHTEQDGWTSSDAANAALVMLDRIDTTDPVDDDRIEGIQRIILQLVNSPIIPDGWKLVPIDPTPAMCEAGYTARDKWNSMQCDNQKELHFSFSQPRYKAMLAAAPKPESE